MTFSPGGPVVALDLAAFPPQLARSYAVGGIPLPTQPTIATAPLSLGGHLSLGDTFSLLFAAPDALTRSLLANGAATTMQFLLSGGVLVSAPVSLAASYSAPTLSVVVTLLAPVSTLPADLPLLLLPSTKAGAFMTVGVFGRLPTDLSGFPATGVYDPSTHSIVAVQAGATTTDSTNSIVYAPFSATVPAFQDTSANGTVTADQDAVSITLPGGQATALIQIATSTLNGTLLFEASPDSGATYYAIQASQVGTSPTVIASSVVGTGGSQAAGVWRCNVAGFTTFRVRLHPTTSGSAVVTLRLSQGVQNVTVNNSSTLGQTTLSASAPVAPASDYVSPVKSVRTEIAGQAAGSVTSTSTDLIPATDVTGYTCAVLQLTGTWSMTLQPAQCNDNTTWLSVQSISAQTFLSNTGVLNSISANGLFVIPLTGRYLRIRPSAWSSNASCVATLELYTTPPPFVVAALGTYVTLTAQTSNVATDFHRISTADTNAVNIKAGTGQIYSYDLSNNNAAWRYVKFYNTAGTPTAGSGTPLRVVGVPPGGKAVFHTTIGVSFSTGIGMTATTGSADNDTGAVGAGDLVIEVDYR